MSIRVTEVLGHYKEQWYIDWVHRVGRTEANKKSKEALKLGSILDKIVKEGLEPAKKAKADTIFAYEAFQKWRRVYQPAYIKPCTRINWSYNGIEITGEPDFEIPNTTVDLKGAVRISSHYKKQVNTYEWGRRLVGLPPNENVAILRCSKELGSYEYWVEPYDQKFVDAWCGLLLNYIIDKEIDNGADVREVDGQEAL